MTPHDILGREFREAFRGYNEDDVDDFLEAVADEYGNLYQEVQRLRVQVASLQRELDEVRGSAVADAKEQVQGEAKDEMRRALVAAQRAAETALAESRERAALIVSEAEARAGEIDAQASARARELDPDAAKAADALRQLVEERRRQEEDIRTRIRLMLEEQIRLLDQVEAQTRHVSMVERMSRELSSSGAPGDPNEVDGTRFWAEPTA